MKKKKVLILSAPEGHASLAKAVRKILGNEFEIKEVELIQDFGSYKLFYRFAPSTFKWIWSLGNKKLSKELMEIYVNGRYAQKIRQVIIDYQPELIVTTYFLYQYELAKLKSKLKFKWINVVQNPESIVPMELALAADYNVGFGDEFVKRGLELGIEEKKLIKIGWLVGEEFYQKLTEKRKRDLLSKLGFKADKLTMVVCGGSEGTNAILKILPDILTPEVAEKFQVVFIAGSNRWLKKTIMKIIELLRKSGRELPKTKVIGFTKQMPDWIRLADVVVGKAGPNLLFESVAAQKPFVAIAHIEGQESGNLELIRRYGLGWVAEDRKLFKKWLEEIIKNPRLLRKWDKNLEAMAKKNKEGLRKLRKLMERLINEE